MLKTIFSACLPLILLSPSMIFPDSRKINKEGLMTQRSSIVIAVLKGDEVIPYLKRLAEIRLLFYRDYPYLYDGTLEEEENYLSTYAHSENTLLVIAKRDEEVVGAILGLPLIESPEENKEAFKDTEVSPAELFYLGDSMVINELKTTDLLDQLYYQFETAVQQFGKYRGIVVCEIERDSNDPKNNCPYEVTWNKKGFLREPSQVVHFSWKEIGDLDSSDHRMIFWSKLL